MHPHMKEHDIKFLVVDQQGFETIIGTTDLIAFGVVPDPELRQVVPREAFVASVQDQPTPARQATVSGVDESLSDKELLDTAKAHFLKETPHLTTIQQHELWLLFLDYKDT